MKQSTVLVALGERSYPIIISADLLQKPNLIQPYMLSKQCLIVTNETIAAIYLPLLTANLECDTIILPDGEQYKNLTSVNKIFDVLMQKKPDRKTLLCALGGGVIGDMAGFAAACYRRGVDFLQIPTTLLAQIDAAIGGKTGVNHPLGKNMIGAFHQPRAVLIDINTLNTLPEREYRAGLAEAIKYGLIIDATFFNFIEQHQAEINARDPSLLLEIIQRCCQIKADIVAADETEQGQRALLNLGHTFAHAIEAATHYQLWLHGEAVALGLIMAADMSKRYAWLTEIEYQRIFTLIRNLHLPVTMPSSLTAEMLWDFVQLDKKTLQQQLRLILLKKIGQAEIVADFKLEDLKNCLYFFTNKY